MASWLGDTERKEFGCIGWKVVATADVLKKAMCELRLRFQKVLRSEKNRIDRALKMTSSIMNINWLRKPI